MTVYAARPGHKLVATCIADPVEPGAAPLVDEAAIIKAVVGQATVITPFQKTIPNPPCACYVPAIRLDLERLR